MSAGELNRRVILQQKSATRDSWGQATDTWQDIATIWAKVEAIGGREALHGKQVESEMTSRVTVRYRAELADPRAVNAWRFSLDGRTLNIQACMFVDDKKRYVALLCGEGLNDGN